MKNYERINAHDSISVRFFNAMHHHSLSLSFRFLCELNLSSKGAGGTQRLTRMIGKSKSMYMSLTGDFMDANEAYTSGLVAKVYDDHDELIKESIQIANKIASKGSISLRACKEAINAADELSLQEGLRLERRLFHSLFATDDQKEGMAAFLEKRPANFK